ncbi:MAG: polysaccharide deacetylase family protein [Verrucomicrobia bacterium]|nr:MAG: polysaccharide deacetylase family protein [Verrucomicrobiota bacterium]PYL46650.1 MAG: polysaccharide deacetylase family protein [Verrucomicrobiota bacterium]
MPAKIGQSVALPGLMLRKFSALFFLIPATTLWAQQPSPSPTKTKTPPKPEPKITISSVRVDGPYIALTFDDGPHQKLTPRLLDLLAEHHIHVTFFVIGENAAEHPEILQRAVREGHEIGNHTWSHPNLAKMTDENVRSQIQRTEEAIRSAIGSQPTLFRPPYGSVTAHQKRFIHDELGYEIILWEVDPLDWKNPGPNVVSSRILKETRPGSIVLAHDIHAQTIQAMPATLTELEAKGFKFVTVSELLKLQTPIPPPTPKPVAPAATPSPSVAASPST